MSASLTDDELRAMFGRHCECRSAPPEPAIDILRTSHSHDCDTDEPELRAAVEIVEARAEIARLTAELAAARTVPADVEAAILGLLRGDRESLDRARAAIARAISEARAAAPSAVGGLTIDEARAVGIAGVRAAIGEVGRQTGPGSHIVEGRGAGEREVEWRLGLLTRGPLSKGG